MNKEILKNTVTRLMQPPKGILAADESGPTCNKRFEKLGIPTTEENRRQYRELLVTAPGIEQYLSGIILFDETIRQSTKDGKSFPAIMQSKGIDIGIKVDKGLTDFPGHPGDKTTEGLEGLTGRLHEYKKMGATFAKWRALLTIGDGIPSEECMKENARIFSEYAKACQAEDIVPIVEPEVLIEGDHSIEKCFEVTTKNFDILFSVLQSSGVFTEGIILKTSMVIEGRSATVKSSPEKIAELTLKCLKEHVPANIGGIVFLSGGQEDEEATMNLNAMHQMGALPWTLSFSFSRALQNSVLKYWAQNPSDISGAQTLFLAIAKNNSDASIGRYKE